MPMGRPGTCAGGVTPIVDAATLNGDLVGELSGPVANMLAKRGSPYLLVTGFIDMAVADPILQTAPRLAKPFTTAGFIEAAVAHLC